MSKAESAHRSSTSTLWPWAVGAFLLGIPMSIFMPPLILVFFVALGVWGVARRGHQTPSSRTALAADLGLGIAAAAYLIIWVTGSITR